jgi:hypothetical protein
MERKRRMKFNVFVKQNLGAASSFALAAPRFDSYKSFGFLFCPSL